jgi:predicted metallopeptidase
MQRLLVDVTARCPVFYHIDTQRMLVGVAQARKARRQGLQAKVTPMRFPGGELTCVRRGRLYQVQRYWVDGVEIHYVITFCLPRFQDQSFEEKLVTIFHELYHIAPSFDGDLRRHPGRYSVHTHSQKELDQQMAALAREYLAGGADPSLHAFLRLSFEELQSRYGQITGLRVPVPRLIRVDYR